MAIAKKQKSKQPKRNSLRRRGHHQQRDERFIKTYWPYVPLLAIVTLGLFFNSHLSQSSVLNYATNMTPPGLLHETNSQRTSYELGTLTINEKLNQAAQIKADDMATRNYWAHITPEGQDPRIFIANSGYAYYAAGENLAYGFANNKEAVRGWMNSEGHKANILNKDYSEVGFGIAHSKNYQNKGPETIVVAMYAQPSPGQPSDTTNTSTASPQSLAHSIQSENNNYSVPSKEVKIARVQLAANGPAAWSNLVFTAIAASLTTLLLYRHSKAWHKFLKRGEAFVLKHKTLDIMIVSGIMMAIILLGTGGVIK